MPQRNISFLANDLAKAGGRRIPVSVLERDNCFACFLAGLAESDLQQSLAFKGGTALKRCYFGDYRFSEDLDFTLLAPIPFDVIRQRLEPVYAAVTPTLRARIAFMFLSKLYRQMYAGTGISTDGARRKKSKTWARWTARQSRKLFAARPMPELISPVWELQFAATGNRPAFLRDEPFVIFPKA